MIALAGVAIDSKIYESSASIVYRGKWVQDDRAIIVKLLKQDSLLPKNWFATDRSMKLLDRLI
jgi:hypothetical protein